MSQTKIKTNSVQYPSLTSFITKCQHHNYNTTFVMSEFLQNYYPLPRIAYLLLQYLCFVMIDDIQKANPTPITSSTIPCIDITRFTQNIQISIRSLYSVRSLLYSLNIIPTTCPVFIEHPKGRPVKSKQEITEDAESAEGIEITEESKEETTTEECTLSTIQYLPLITFLQVCEKHDYDPSFIMAGYVQCYGDLPRTSYMMLEYLCVKIFNNIKDGVIKTITSYNADMFQISLSQFMSVTGSSKPSCYSARSLLYSLKIIPSNYPVFQEQHKGRPAKKTADSSTPENSAPDNQLPQAPKEQDLATWKTVTDQDLPF